MQFFIRRVVISGVNVIVQYLLVQTSSLILSIAILFNISGMCPTMYYLTFSNFLALFKNRRVLSKKAELKI